MSDHTPWPLIAKYLAGECSADERLTMEWWLEEVDNRILFEQIRLAWQQENPAEEATFDVGRGLDLLHSRMGIEEPEAPAPDRFHLKMSSWLAAACLVIMVGLGYYFINRQPARLSEIRLSYVTKASGTDSISHVTLPDGSQVWLNKDSKIRYPEAFAGDTRAILLEGEAFFEVVHNAAKPFIVRSKKVSTRVLGTSFNVKAYGTDPIASVAVATGKVEVSKEIGAGAPIRITQLTPQQELVMDTEKDETYMDIVSTFDVGGWRRDQLVFRNNTYKEVITRLESTYNVNIELKGGNLAGCRVMASFNEGAALNDVLKLLSISNSFKYQIKGSRVTITGGTCR